MGLDISMQTSKDLKEKIRGLETERAYLATEVEKLRKAAETHAASLEEEVNRMREERRILNEILAPNEASLEVSTISPFVPKPTVVAQPNPVEEQSEPIVTTSLEQPPAEGNIEVDEKKYDSLLKSLNDSERSIMEVVLSHNGKCPQRLIRTEAGLSWLETRRIISRLSERGIVKMDNDGAENNVSIADHWK